MHSIITLNNAARALSNNQHVTIHDFIIGVLFYRIHHEDVSLVFMGCTIQTGTTLTQFPNLNNSKKERRRKVFSPDVALVCPLVEKRLV